MDIIRGIHNLKSYHYGYAITIGNFDGFHYGHKLLIKELHNKSNKLNLPSMVMIFEPQPYEYFNKSILSIRLTTFRDKIKYLSAANVNTVICITFNKNFAKISANDFIKKILIKKLGICFIIIGDDFRFGYNQEGDYNLLKKIGKISGFKTNKISTYTKDGIRISSSLIRKKLLQNNLIKTKYLLGHNYSISGKVIHGNALGRLIGFPTANIYIKKRYIPLNGVYAVLVYGITKRPLYGVANIGIRPTINGKNQKLEVHLLNINICIYNNYIEIVIHKKIRNEKKFNSLIDLKIQIAHDINDTYTYFKTISY